MPIYEYQCEACGHQFEEMRRITDETTPSCPQCGSDETKKRVSHSSFVLKGTGWYVTDYKDKSSSDGNGKSNTNGDKKDKSDSDSSGSSKDEASSSGKSDAADSKPKKGNDNKPTNSPEAA